MKFGDKVFVYQDGKLGRRGEGVVVQTRNGHHVKISFTYQGETAVTWFRKLGVKHGRYPRGHGQFGGWSTIDTFCPWFAVVKARGLK